MPTASLSDGFEMYYEDDDFTDPWKETRTVLLQHGLCSSSRLWYPWVPPLVSKYRVIRPDARGWGRSTVTDVSSLSIDRYVEDLSEFIDQLGIGPVHYCGQLLGGVIGVVLAARYPKKVASLTLVSSPPTIPEEAQRNFAFGYPDQVEAMKHLGAEGWARAGSARRFPPDADPGLVEWYDSELGRSDLAVMMAVARQIPGLTVEPLLPELSCPVLALYPEGGHGHIASEQNRRDITTKIKDARMVFLPGEYHLIANLYPERCTQEFLSFIEGVGR